MGSFIQAQLLPHEQRDGVGVSCKITVLLSLETKYATLVSCLQARDAILIQVSDSINSRILRERLNATKKRKERKEINKYPLL